jgi:hypothetical protein
MEHNFTPLRQPDITGCRERLPAIGNSAIVEKPNFFRICPNNGSFYFEVVNVCPISRRRRYDPGSSYCKI